jgi:hypothetical protein
MMQATELHRQNMPEIGTHSEKYRNSYLYSDSEAIFHRQHGIEQIICEYLIFILIS